MILCIFHIDLLKTQSEASKRNPQIPPFLTKSELRDKVLRGFKANSYFINALNQAVSILLYY